MVDEMVQAWLMWCMVETRSREWRVLEAFVALALMKRDAWMTVSVAQVGCMRYMQVCGVDGFWIQAVFRGRGTWL